MSDDYLDITPAELEGKIVVKLYQDELAENPRESFDHAGTLYCDRATSPYDLSDKGAGLPASAVNSQFEDIAVAARWVELHGGVAVPFRIVDHGNAYPTDADNANGLVWIEADKIAVEWTAHGETEPKAAAKRCLTAEITELSQYLAGEVFGFVIETPEGEHLDSCWGFYGQEYATEAALEVAPFSAGQLDERKRDNVAARAWAFSQLFGAAV